MSYVGDIALSQTLNTKFATVQATGAPTTLSSSPVISAYVGSSTTEITAGITLTVDFDSRTGLNNVTVVASGANGYAINTDVQLVITTGTVNSVSAVGYVVCEFSIENRGVIVTKLGPIATATVQTARDIGASVLLSAGSGTGQLDFTSGVVKANATQWVGGTIPAVNVTGVPLVDAKYLLGTIFSTPATAGIIDVNLKNIANATVSATTAQLGVNVVNIKGTASAGTAGYVAPDFTTVTLPLGSVPSLAIVENGTLQSATATTAVLRSATNFGADSRPVGMTLYIVAGTGLGQSRIITGYVNATDTATVDTWTTTPDNTSTYIIYPTPPGSVSVPVPTNVTQWLGTAVSTPTVAGVPNVNVKTWNDLTTVALPLVPTTAGRTLDVSTTGEAGIDWANVGSPTTTLNLSGTTIAVTQKVDVDTIKTNPVVNGGTVTFPTNATLASTTNITAGTIATVTNLTNAPGAGDLTATMKTSVQTAAQAALTASGVTTANGITKIAGVTLALGGTGGQLIGGA